MNELEQIMTNIKKNKPLLKDKYNVKTIGIFGSYLHGIQKKRSDVDILVEFEPGSNIDLFRFVELENYLTDLIGVKVDLVMKSVLKPRIGKHILNEVVYL